MIQLKGSDVLVTGASGFIGSHLVEALVHHGCKVRILVTYDTGPNIGCVKFLSDEVREKIEIVVGDIKNADDVRTASNGVKFIFHLAALVGIPYSYLHPRSVVETNLIGTLNVLMAGRENNVERIVHTSTSEVYGTAEYVPIDENHPLQGQSPYSASKIGADKIVESFYCSFNLPVTTMRPFNQYGPRQSARAVIPTIITQCLTQDVVRLGALHPTRDFTYVEDTADAFLKIATSEKAIGEVINIGTQKEISIGDLTKKIMSLVGKHIKIVAEEERVRTEKSEVYRLLCDNSKAKKLIGWEPSTSLDEGLEKTIQWISSRLDIYEPDKYAI
jgi:dTDP-glucose 4,6-dehydratase